jgi:hypothetical protein
MTQPAVEPVYGSDYGLQLEGDGVDPSDGTAGTFWLVMLLVGGSYMPVRRFAPESGHKWLWRGMSAYDPKRTFTGGPRSSSVSSRLDALR